MPKTYDVVLAWDAEAEVWTAVNDEIPVALESPSLDALIERVRLAIPELLALNKRPQNAVIRFYAEHFETVGV